MNKKEPVMRRERAFTLIEGEILDIGVGTLFVS